ncbi:hypothetical protein K1T71_014981 [Dendrolimus kikuchii]|nr:hypothetical protein K1T71_014981 [Dendrolimus kikuchii]
MLLNELKFQPEDFKNYFFFFFKSADKHTYFMRNSISAHERLSVTLRFLATGRCYEDLKFSAFPTSEGEWKEIAKMYEERWNFPHCLGAIDGKHTAIVPPANSGSYFYNYKGQHSVVLMAIVNAKYRFVYIDIGMNEPENIDKEVKASCVLHNFLIEHSKKSYAPQKCFYRENSENGTIISEGYNTQNSTMENLERRNPRNTLNNAKIVRNNFMNYFNQKGRVPWQNDHVN